MTNHIPANTLVLVTGGTGFTGAVLVKKLLEQGLKVRVIARPSERAKKLATQGCEVILGQVYDPEIIKQACQDVEYIFHVAAAFREPGIADDVYTKVHVDSTRMLAEAVTNQPNFKRFIHVSTIGVHGHIDEPPANEEYRYSPGDIYQTTKLEGELWISEYGKTHNFPVTVIRPATIYGPGDQRLLKLFKMACKPFFPVLGNGRCLLHLTHVEDLADSFILAATHPAAVGEVFICGDREPVSLEKIVKVIARENGKKIHFIRIPAAPFFLLAYLCEIICKPFGINPPIFRRRVAFFTKDRSFDTSKIHSKLGHENKMTNEGGIVQTFKWYKENKWLMLSFASFELQSIFL